MVAFSGYIDPKWSMTELYVKQLCEEDITTTSTELVGTATGSRSAGSAAGEAAVSAW